MLGPEYTVRLYRSVPETRWVRRVILRRKTRLVLVFAGVPTAYDLSGSINSANSLHITAEDSMTWLQRMQIPGEED